MWLSDIAPALRHLKVALELRERIKRGDYEVGARFPTGREIADEFHVALATAQKAVKVLRAEGLVSTHGSGGTIVLAVPAGSPNPESELAALSEKMETVRAQIEQLSSRMDELTELSSQLEKLKDTVARLEKGIS